MSLINLGSESEFTNIVKSGVTLVDFYADWCGPCKMLAPVLEELAQEVDVTILKVNVDQNPNIAQQYGIMSIPAIHLFKDGEVVTQKVGFQTKEMLKKFIETAK